MDDDQVRPATESGHAQADHRIKYPAEHQDEHQAVESQGDGAEVIGPFRDVRNHNRGEFLRLGFRPALETLRRRWRNNGLSADFLGDYVMTFIERGALDEAHRREAERTTPWNDDPPPDRPTLARGAVTFIVNELLENAMKYSEGTGDAPVELGVLLDDESVWVSLVNHATPAHAARYRAFVQSLFVNDVSELFLERLEAQAASPTSSGLGFLTMLNDYRVVAAWRFRPIERDVGLGDTPFPEVEITTEIELKISELDRLIVDI